MMRHCQMKVLLMPPHLSLDMSNVSKSAYY
jgi:hypothetical protein